MRYDKMCEAFGGYGEYVTKPEDIRPALERAQAKVDEGMVALVNVRTDYRARYGGVWFSDYSTRRYLHFSPARAGEVGTRCRPAAMTSCASTRPYPR